ncbi:hypothetical protein [Streptomyces resistomycificus]|uniref:Uncharacterized protein n=1 Tax=Streptomyces resistomycificus TaxID=67356 RepID=A0A0L8KRP9_9ACTN|nr:hypothetical protein [Streptomyces resistomycificus]KOG28618.1 hypothetical protein ADK37_39085 [Streptomyces resistomycificus]KUN95744.1 hypothetical protein AQJ84_21410 [Streptomyces resistomycificus]
MTAQTSEKPVARRPETGWSRARRLRGAPPLRTCLPALEDGATPHAVQPPAEGNIYRGED